MLDPLPGHRPSLRCICDDCTLERELVRAQMIADSTETRPAGSWAGRDWNTPVGHFPGTESSDRGPMRRRRRPR